MKSSSSRSSAESSLSSSKSLFFKKNKLLDPSTDPSKDPLIVSNQSSQSDVSWRYYEASSSCDSPQRQVGGNTKQKSANQLLQTPVRIVKRHVSSPNFNNLKSNYGFGRQIGEALEGRQTIKNSFGLSHDEFKYESDEEELLGVIREIDETKIHSHNKFLTKSSSVSVSRQYLKEINLEDSFDDAMLNSIPLDEIRKQCSSKIMPNVDIVFDPTQGLTEIRLSQAANNSPKKTVEMTVKILEKQKSPSGMKQKERELPKSHQNRNGLKLALGSHGND